MASRTSSSVTAAHDPPDRRMASSAYQPSAGFPMASDLAMVLGLTGRMASVPSAKAVATGAQPAACAPETRTVGSSSSRPTCPSSAKPLATLVSCAARANGHDHVVGSAPAELLGHLEGQGLRSFGVVGAHVHVHERPRRLLAGELGAEAVDVVVASLDREHGPP